MTNLGKLSGSILSVTLLALASSIPTSWGTDPPPTRPAARVASAVDPAQPLAFEITCDPALHAKPLRARVYVMLGSEQAGLEPRNGPNWFRPEPFFAVDVASWLPGKPLAIDSTADGFPLSLGQLKAGRYSIQAVVRLNLDTHRIGDGEGNLFGPVVRAELDPSVGGKIALKADQIVPPRKFTETDRIKLVEIESPILSAFYHRPIQHRAAVILPKSMTEKAEQSRFPTLYIIPGFGGDHFMVERWVKSPQMKFGEDFIRVILNPDCGTGHHVFADSRTNGPRGTALVKELIPHIERTYPAIALPNARLLNGHSSGGWSSLWLQVTYPDEFGGTWSTSPDPVDFRDFQRINLYNPGENMFTDHEGKRRPIARLAGVPTLYYDNFSRLDDVIKWGSQLGSFEAVFSPLDPGGQPRKLWNRVTGVVDTNVGKAWEAYDIRLVLERKWSVLGPKLKGKLHVVTGGMDTFYLEGAAGLLKESLARLGSDATVEIVPGKDHGSVLTPDLAQRLDREMHATAGIPLPAQKPTTN